MSALMMDLRTVSHHGRTVTVFDAGVGRTHPRGHGFRVLSRIARTQSDDDGYAPRHRRDVSLDLDVRAVLAS
jgi:hypothetical protein